MSSINFYNDKILRPNLKEPPKVRPAQKFKTAKIINPARKFYRTPIRGSGEEVPEEVEELLAEFGLSGLERTSWLASWARMASRVCRISWGTNVGTGFLIGPDLVLTNFHVVEVLVLDVNKVIIPLVDLTFDVNDASQAGVSYKLADDWLVASSPASLADTEADPATEATALELDYAVLRLSQAPSLDIVDGAERGVIDIPSDAYTFIGDEPLIIIQHSVQEPLRTAFEPLGISVANTGNTRVTYRTNTRGGASGSPCFNRDWRLVALHHAGPVAGGKNVNKGIPIHTIRESFPPPPVP